MFPSEKNKNLENLKKPENLQGASKKSWFSGKSAVANITSDREKSMSTFAQIQKSTKLPNEWS